jgi:hypothetical protein
MSALATSRITWTAMIGLLVGLLGREYRSGRGNPTRGRLD